MQAAVLLPLLLTQLLLETGGGSAGAVAVRAGSSSCHDRVPDCRATHAHLCRQGQGGMAQGHTDFVACGVIEAAISVV